ncbi:MAG TPA: serine/threonine-protein phosphatase [Candidatus Gallacutalibacter stercoravium]|nr:serine/threonine-protein phosphatase [Candidatus Gallacutalibacter stercoravium]
MSRKRRGYTFFLLLLCLSLLTACSSFTQGAEEPAVVHEEVSSASSSLDSEEESGPLSSFEAESSQSVGEGQNSAPSGIVSQTEQEGGFSFAQLLWPAVAVVVVLIIVAVCLIVHKKKHTVPPVSVEQPQEQGPAGVAVENVVQAQAPGVFSLAIGNAHHIGKRSSQQDCFAVSDVTNPALCAQKGVLAVVADGMGGLSNGAQVSALVTSTMMGYFDTHTMRDAPATQLLTMINEANRQVLRGLGNAQGQSGSTVVAVLIQDGGLYFASVGDSRIYLLRGGVLMQINREHTYAAELDEKVARGEISQKAAQEDPQRNALTSYIGMGALEKVDHSLNPLALQQGDRILLMSDGVFGTLSSQEIASAAQNGDAFEAAQRLEQAVLAKDKPGQDNFTAVILQCV